ncbi:hypothetical protein [Komagataeibacter nataicola]|uniref:hypothetical protein n=1 Tax=Komagataeibacter nataicola TaxID=265960 RepID=UPI0011B3B907|nr:hypothetical protein [Komagataeibacter nataicola]WNM07296.1 hypothetical protein RI056_00195 [Komagataeibacter nataicola]
MNLISNDEPVQASSTSVSLELATLVLWWLCHSLTLIPSQAMKNTFMEHTVNHLGQRKYKQMEGEAKWSYPFVYILCSPYALHVGNGEAKLRNEQMKQRKHHKI